MKPTEFSGSMAAYARDASRDVKNQLSFGKRLSQKESFQEHFGEGPAHEEGRRVGGVKLYGGLPADELGRSAAEFYRKDLMRLVAGSNLEREYNEWPGEQEFTRLLAGRIQQHICRAGAGKELDPIMMAIMIEALILFWSQNGQYYAGLFEEPLEKVTGHYLDHIDSLFFSDPDTKEKQ